MFFFILSLASIDDLFLKKKRLYSGEFNHLYDYSPGWYYFYIKHKSFLRDLNITLKTSNLITNRWASIYLDSSQISHILSNSSYTIIPEKEFSKAQTLSVSDSDSYLIESHEDYIPPDSERFYSNFYISKNFPKNSPYIRSITSLPRAEIQNRWTKGVVQSDHFNLHFEDNLRLVPYQPFYSHGIRGQNEVVTIIDSGIDHRHCFYNDPLEPVPFDQTNFNHRKIVRYQIVADRFDGENGHGTHVSGIIAGKSLCENCSSSMYNGIAPEAKIFFIDTGDEKDSVSLSQHFSFEYMLSIATNLNSHVFSNSWGFSSSTKKVRKMFDQIAFDNPYMSFFFGTGNSRKFFDIFTPASSKNVISVGNIEVEQLRRYKDGYHDIFVLKSETRNKSFIIKNLNFSESLLRKITYENELKNYQKKEIIIYNESIVDYKSSFVYLKSNISSSSKICQILQNLENKSISLLFTKNSNFTCKNISISFPIFSISKSLRNKELVSLHTSVNYSGIDDGLSFVNSYGPTKQGLLKPEIFAPGNQTMSARGANSYRPAHECSTKDGLVMKSGTSMATPAVAGAAVLLNQYFRDGFYPTCQRNKLNSLLVSSMLVKAILVNSASRIKNMNSSIKKPPLNGGFGSIHLGNSLLLDQNLTENGFRICDRIKISSKEDIFTTITLNECKNMSPLKVTLSWLDPPLDTESKMPLFADLDLYVITPSQKVVYGNNDDYEESHSTTEKVIIDDPQSGEYQIHIYCHKLSIDDTQILFSLAINGPFDQLDFEKNPKKLVFNKTRECIGCKGQKCEKESGKCVCYKNQTGIHCSNQVHFLNFESNHFVLESRKPFYLYLQIPDNLTETQYLSVYFKFVNCLLVHMSVGANQVPKFGGKFVNYLVTRSSQSFEINPQKNDKFKKGSFIYFGLFECTKHNPELFVNLTIQDSFVPKTLELPKPIKSPILTTSAKINQNIQKNDRNCFYFMVIGFIFILTLFSYLLFKKIKCGKKIKMKIFNYERLPTL